MGDVGGENSALVALLSSESSNCGSLHCWFSLVSIFLLLFRVSMSCMSLSESSVNGGCGVAIGLPPPLPRPEVIIGVNAYRGLGIVREVGIGLGVSSGCVIMLLLSGDDWRFKFVESGDEGWLIAGCISMVLGPVGMLRVVSKLIILVWCWVTSCAIPCTWLA